MVRTRGPVVIDASTDGAREGGTVLSLVATLVADKAGASQAGTVEVLVGLKGLVAPRRRGARA